jgi:hypothetical protein
VTSCVDCRQCGAIGRNDTGRSKKRMRKREIWTSDATGIPAVGGRVHLMLPKRGVRGAKRPFARSETEGRVTSDGGGKEIGRHARGAARRRQCAVTAACRLKVSYRSSLAKGERSVGLNQIRAHTSNHRHPPIRPIHTGRATRSRAAQDRKCVLVVIHPDTDHEAVGGVGAARAFHDGLQELPLRG